MTFAFHFLFLSVSDLKSFLKTSGGKGYHVVIPLNCKNWDICNDFAKQVAELLQQKYPKLFTTNSRKAERGGKIFVDYLRNTRGATCVGPYSLRARNGATISMPIAWQDLTKIKPNQITIKNYKKYIKNNNREFAPLNKIEETFLWCKKYNINKINIDLMYGLENQTKNDLKNNINLIKHLKPSQVTLYEMRTNVLNIKEYKTNTL